MPTKHDAFISYSHSADSRLAKAIEEGIERLAKPLLKVRAADVFRDETSLTANPSLWGRSRTICSVQSGSCCWLVPSQRPPLGVRRKRFGGSNSDPSAEC